MTQAQIDELDAIRLSITAAYTKYQEEVYDLNQERNLIWNVCDHVFPDGRNAVCQSGRCAICTKQVKGGAA